MHSLKLPSLLSIITLVSAIDPSVFTKRGSSPNGYYNPLDSGGGMITIIPNAYPAGVGEPANAILSGNSDADVLVDQESDGGLRNYFLSFGYASECLGQHAGTGQALNLGDGHGPLNETAVIRWDYGDPALGTCKETALGGSHFRYWVQNGPKNNSGAVFMAFSYELPLEDQHGVVVNGYNLGRDWGVGNITSQSTIINTATVSNASTFTGRTQYGGYTYETTVQYISGLLPNSSTGINHGDVVGVNGVNACDGLVALMQAKIVERPQSSSSPLSVARPLSWTLAAVVALAASHLFL